MEHFEYVSPCHFGMEAVLKRELADLGIDITSVSDGRVTFSGGVDVMARANIFLRTTERVLLQVGKFQATTFDELFEKTKSIEWERYIPKNGKFWVAKATSVKSKLFSPSDIQSIIKKAIVERLKKVYFPLRAYHLWMKKNRTWRDGSYWSSGWGCGMDNIPRLEPGYDESFSHGHMVWLDACAQELLNCDILIKMNEILKIDDVSDLIEERESLTKLINDKLWDEETGFYYDMWKNGELNMVKHVGAFWTLIARIVPKERLERFVSHLADPNEFNRPNTVPSLSADHPLYNPHGEYWRGSSWAPTTYMVFAGLTANGCHDLAYQLAEKFLKNVVDVYNETGTLWENYAPDFAERGNMSRPNFVGWTGLAPISVFFEYIIGIKAQVSENRIVWHVNRTERHGIEKYPFGNDHLIDLVCEARESADEEPKITVRSNKPIDVLVVWNGKEKLIKA